MTRLRLATLLLAAVTVIPGCATQPTSRADLLAQYAVSLDLEGLMREQREAGLATVKSQLGRASEHFRNLGLPEPALREIQEAIDAFADKVLASFDPKEASRVFMAALTADFSDADLRREIAESNTANGKRMRNASRAAGRALRDFYAQAMSAALKEAAPAYIERLTSIAQRYKPAPASP